LTAHLIPKHGDGETAALASLGIGDKHQILHVRESGQQLLEMIKRCVVVQIADVDLEHEGIVRAPDHSRLTDHIVPTKATARRAP